MAAKLFTYGVLVQIFLLSLLCARNASGQYKSAQYITVPSAIQGLSIASTFDLIESCSDLTFVYLKKDISRRASVELDPAKDRSVLDILISISKSSGLKFRRVNNGVSVSKITKEELKRGIQRITEKIKVSDITGKVTDENGEGLPGAAIKIKGTGQGTVTNIDGNYNLKNVPQGTILLISFVGYKVQEVKVGSKSVIDIQLKPDAKQLKDVVVTGYQTIDRRLFSGAADHIKAEDVKVEGLPDISKALQGESAGVEVENVSGTFGVAPVFRIRGNTTISGNNRPLWVVDGVVLEEAVELSNDDITSGNLNTLLSSSTIGINPEDIESIEVLKDISATGLYGSRAANGVVVITTKRPSKEQTSISFKSQLIVTERPRHTQFNNLSSGGEIGFYQELYDKGWIGAGIYSQPSYGAFGKMFREIEQGRLAWGPRGGLNYDFLQRYAQANTDWFGLLFSPGVSLQNNISINTGNQKRSFRVSLSHLNDKISIADKADNYTLLMRVDFSLGKKKSSRLGFKVTTNVRDQKTVAVDDRNFDNKRAAFSRSFDINPYNYALNTARSITPYDAQGNLEFFRKNFAPFNILHELDRNSAKVTLLDFAIQSDFSFQLSKSLSISSSFNARRYAAKTIQTIHETSNQAEAYRADSPEVRQQNSQLYRPPQADSKDPFSILPQGGIRKEGDHALASYFGRATLEFSPEIPGGEHEAGALLGQEIRYTDRRASNHEGWGYLFDRGGLVLDPHPSFSAYLRDSKRKLFNSTESRQRSMGTFVNLSYAFRRKYSFNATFRYDGSNRTGGSRQARYLPSWNVSGAWNLDKEFFLGNVAWLEQLKVKSTYGFTGQLPGGASANFILRPSLINYWDAAAQRNALKQGVNLYLSNFPNVDLTYEKTFELNVGMEMRAFRFLFLELNYYQRHNKDLLGFVQSSGISGQTREHGNIGEMKTSGLELTIKTMNIQTDHFTWTTKFTYSGTKNQITKWMNLESRASAVGSATGVNLEGYPMRTLFSIPFAGLSDYGVPLFYEGKGISEQFQNLASNFNVTRNLILEGSTEPNKFGGMNHDFAYKGWTLSINFFYRWGLKKRLQPSTVSKSGYNDYRSLPREMMNRWAVAGDEQKTNVPVIPTKELYERHLARDAGDIARLFEQYNNTSLRIADGSFIRVKSIRLTYQLPQKFLQKTFLKSAGLAFAAHNLWLLYSDTEKLQGLDPEFYQSGGISLPQSRRYTFSVNINF